MSKVHICPVSVIFEFLTILKMPNHTDLNEKELDLWTGEELYSLPSK